MHQIVAESGGAHRHLIEGRSLMDPLLEMTTDGIHPKDKGFAQIAERLDSRLATQILVSVRGK